MEASGGKKPEKQIVKLPPKRSPHEWREIFKAKMQHLEAVSFEIMGKRQRNG